MSDTPVLELALRLWPKVRDGVPVDDPADLDRLLEAQGLPGAPGFEAGVRGTFACFAPDEAASLTLPTGEVTTSDAEARFVAHLLVTRTLLAAGLHIDDRVVAALSDAHALSWTTRLPGDYGQTPLALAVSLWLIALDPLGGSDRPLPIDWTPTAYQDPERWDLDYRLFSHYDVRERAIDWATYVSGDSSRHEGSSAWLIAESLLRLEQDGRVRIALGHLSESAARAGGGRGPAAAMLERGRIAALLQAFVNNEPRGSARGGNGGGRPRPQF